MVRMKANVSLRHARRSPITNGSFGGVRFAASGWKVPIVYLYRDIPYTFENSEPKIRLKFDQLC
jgi:hypothetical protein